MELEEALRLSVLIAAAEKALEELHEAVLDAVGDSPPTTMVYNAQAAIHAVSGALKPFLTTE